MSVSDALAIINDVLGEILDGEDAELDADTRFAVTWYSPTWLRTRPFGETLTTRREPRTHPYLESTPPGIGQARAGKFRLYRRDELDAGWSPQDDNRLTVWKATQQLVAALDRSESEAADLLHQLGAYGDPRPPARLPLVQQSHRSPQRRRRGCGLQRPHQRLAHPEGR